MDNTKKWFIGSVAFNIIVLLVIASFYLGGWMFISILYGVVMTALAGWLFFRGVDVSNEYQDIIDSLMNDVDLVIERLEPYLGPNSYIAYSEEVQGLILGIKSFRKRMQQHLDAYLGKEEKEEEVPKQQQRPRMQEGALASGQVMNLPRRSDGSGLGIPTSFDH